MASEVAPGGYLRTVIARNEKFEIIACEWKEGQGSSFHDHGLSQCWVTVESGVFENVAEWAGTRQSAAFSVGQVISTPLGARHAMRCLSGSGKTLHVYSPPLQKSVAGETRSEAPRPDLALRDHGLAWAEVEALAWQIQEASVPTRSPEFMNQLFSGLHPEALLASRLAAETRTTLATLEASPVLSRIETEVVQALGKEIGWELSRRGGLAVPGGSAANFMALHLARYRKSPETKKAGVLLGPAFAVFTSDQSHYSIQKACAVLGLGTDAVRRIPSDPQGRMIPEALESSIAESRAAGQTPLAVIATAGTTVLGAFDPLDEIAPICRKSGVWLHVDAAWGGPAIFSHRLKNQIQGIDQADSVTFDAHKLLGATLTSSFFLTPHPKLLLEANDVSGADYLFHGDVDLGRASWQCGRGPDALGLWMLWKSRGVEGFSRQIDHLLEVRDEVMPWISDQPRLRWVARPDYLNLCIQVLPPIGSEALASDWSIRVRTRLRDSSKAWVNFSRTATGESFLRMILVHPSIEARHVLEILAAALEVVE